MPRDGFQSISLRDEIVADIDRCVSKRGAKYRSRADLVTHAVNELLGRHCAQA